MEILSWLTAPQAAKRLGVSVFTVYRALDNGRIEFVQTPLGVLVKPASVEDYARTRRPVRRKGERVQVSA
jgi:excisionase family DNA binding protein